jgi:hypothetical protein
MIPAYVIQNGAGISPWKVMNTHATIVNIGIGCSVSGQATYTVEYTYDDPNNLPPGASGPQVFQLSSMTNLTTSADGALLQPVTAMRVNVSVGTGTVRMTLVQSDIVG